MEAFGLAVIVILIIIGFFIFVSFKAKEKANVPTYQKDYITDQTPVKFVLAFTALDVEECSSYRNKQNIRNLIYDCATTNKITCSGKDSCTVVNETLFMLLNNTFIPRDSSFVVYTRGMGTHDITISNLGCTADATTTKGYVGLSSVTLYPYPGTVEVDMAFCTQ